MHRDLEDFIRRYGLSPEAQAELMNVFGRMSTAPLELDTGQSTLVDDMDSTAPEIDLAQIEFRYRGGNPIGQGGVGVVNRVYDAVLRRTLAMKVLRERYADQRPQRQRFVAEAQTTASLQHPGIVPVHDLGRLPDGKVYFTMKEVLGRTLAQAIAVAHHRGPPDASALHQLVDAFRRVCEAVAYAHSRGVVHRDLKPSNVMLGDFGEVLVMDWGLARSFRDEDGPIAPVAEEPTESQLGPMAGTPAYMSPEQARGLRSAVEPRSDVYSLGAILYEILWGRRAYQHVDKHRLLMAVATASAKFPPGGAPEELVEVCRRAMAERPEDRPRHAGELADQIALWLGGSRRRAHAADSLDRAMALRPEIEEKRRDAGLIRTRAEQALAALEPWDPVDLKRPYWERLELADALEREANEQETRSEILLHNALSHASDLVSAHAALAELYRRRQRVAERRGDTDAADHAADLLRNHVRALPADDLSRASHEAFLEGTGRVTLHTDPPGAEVELHRVVTRERRLQTKRVGTLGTTPLDQAPIEMGSWMLVLREEGHAEVRYPVQIGRQEHWDGLPPDETEPHVVHLPALEDLPEGQCYVPAGWFHYGHASESPTSFAAGRAWCPAFVVCRDPVTNRQYLEFLNDLVDQGRQDEAEHHAPSLGPGEPAYARDADGRFTVAADPDGDQWQLDWPVICVNLADAEAYAAWFAERTGLPWRLPAELEWEKAARGVDGRIYPWGDFMDATWANLGSSRSGRSLPVGVAECPIDESPYGVRGLAGNSDDWTGDFLADPPRVVDGRVVRADPDPDRRDARAVRGGFWSSAVGMARAHNRNGVRPSARLTHLGFRLFRSLP